MSAPSYNKVNMCTCKVTHRNDAKIFATNDYLKLDKWLRLLSPRF